MFHLHNVPQLRPIQHIRHMRPPLKPIIFGGLGGVGVFGILFSVALYIVEALIRPKKLSVFDSYTFTPFELDLPAEVVTFPSLHGDHTLTAWYIPREQATTTILICPGYRTRKADMLGMSSFLWKAGHNVLVFDYYGHGTEGGIPVTLGYREVNDFLGAVAYAKERAPQNHIGVVAYSMGAAVAIMGSALTNDVEALVADSPFATHTSAVTYNIHRVLHMPSTPVIWMADYLLWLRAGYHFRQVEPLRDIARFSPRPILLIHNGKDSLIDPHDGTLLYEAAGKPKEVWFVPEADHCGAYFIDRAGYIKKVTDFFDLHLKNQHPHLQLLEQTSTEPVDTHVGAASDEEWSAAS